MGPHGTAALAETIRLLMGEFAEAGPLLERAAAIWTDKLGPEHPDTQTAMGWLEIVKREMA